MLNWLKSVLGGNEGTETVDRTPRAEKTTVTVTNVMEVSGVGTVVTAKVETGVLRRGDRLVFENDETTTVESIERHHEEVEKAEAGDRVGIELGVEPTSVPEDATAEVR